MSMSWSYVGDLDVSKEGRLPLLHIPAAPGLYRLVSGQNCYVGQAKNLRNRVYEYCRPTQHLEHEHRLHALLRGKPCRVEVMVMPQMESLAFRRSQELLAFAEARQAGLFLWNLSQHSKADQYGMLISYHEAMIQKYGILLTACEQAA